MLPVSETRPAYRPRAIRRRPRRRRDRHREARHDIRRAKVVTFDDSVGRLPHDTWLREHAPEARVVLRSNRQQTLIEGVRLGVGLGILPCLAADTDRAPRRLLGPEAVFSRDLWLLTHADVQHSPRVRAVLGAIAAYVSPHARRLSGAGPRG